ncbi:MAG: hypothetical protein JW384_02127 [Nitrosomonadaceae bacterium]|nr:hypothetical protein [Nitrosomonadaceae bacterium]
MVIALLVCSFSSHVSKSDFAGVRQGDRPRQRSLNPCEVELPTQRIDEKHLAIVFYRAEVVAAHL